MRELILERSDARTEIENMATILPGSVDEYFVRFTDQDKVGFSARQHEPDAGVAAALKDPENQRVWADMQRDPRVQIMPDNRMPGRQQGVRIPSRRQYDRQHPAHLSQR